MGSASCVLCCTVLLCNSTHMSLTYVSCVVHKLYNVIVQQSLFFLPSFLGWILSCVGLQINRVEPSSSFFGPARFFFKVFELGSRARDFLGFLFEARLVKDLWGSSSTRTRFLFLKWTSSSLAQARALFFFPLFLKPQTESSIAIERGKKK
jgi:hypothetical protein